VKEGGEKEKGGKGEGAQSRILPLPLKGWGQWLERESKGKRGQDTRAYRISTGFFEEFSSPCRQKKKRENWAGEGEREKEKANQSKRPTWVPAKPIYLSYLFKEGHTVGEREREKEKGGGGKREGANPTTNAGQRRLLFRPPGKSTHSQKKGKGREEEGAVKEKRGERSSYSWRTNHSNLVLYQGRGPDERGRKKKRGKEGKKTGKDNEGASLNDPAEFFSRPT